MSRAIPNYLKLHVEELAASARAAVAALPHDGLCHSFAAATGWQLPLTRLTPPRRRSGRPRDVEGIGFERVEAGENQHLELARVKPLALAIGKVVAELEEARRTLAEREAELATAIPVNLPRDDARPLLRRLENLLKIVTESVQARAAALYLLDDATSRLKLRAHYGLSADRFYAPPRPLRGQGIDLEALLGRTVVIPHVDGSQLGVPPEPCRAAVCAPVSSPTVPLGTLWVFAAEPREFTPLQSNLIEVTAGRIAAELERHALGRETVQLNQMRRQWQQARRWLQARVPLVEPLADAWDVAGWTPQSEQLSGQFVDWEVLPDERLLVALGRAPGVALDASLSAVTLQSLFKALSPKSRDPRRLLGQVHATAWRTAAGASLGSLITAAVHPESDEIQISGTGEVSGLVVGRSRCQVVGVEPHRIGESPEARFALQRLALQPGDSLLLMGAPLKKPAAGMEPLAVAAADESSVRPLHFALEVDQLAELVRQHASQGASLLVDGLRRAAERAGEDAYEPAALLVVQRRATP